MTELDLRILGDIADGLIRQKQGYMTTHTDLYVKGRVNDPIWTPNQLNTMHQRLREWLSQGLVDLPEDPGPYVLTESGEKALASATEKANDR